MKKPFTVTIEVEKNTAGPHRPPVLEWSTRTETVWATSLAEVRRICRGRFGVIPTTVTDLWARHDELMSDPEIKELIEAIKIPKITEG